MVRLGIQLGERSYPIYIATDFTDLPKVITSAHLQHQCVVIMDQEVARHQAPTCMEVLEHAGIKAETIVIPAGEDHKNLDTVKDIYCKLYELKLDRNATLIALGGGVTGDITGFVASTYLRGINFVQVPTTLLAQADSSVGGKVGVDFAGGKNLIGAFYQPKLVYINVNTLRTLPENQLRSGLAEVIKHGLIMDADFFDYIDYNLAKIFAFDANVLQYMTKKNRSIKGTVVEQDEKESDLRAILNFGHTYGHAIESESGFSLLHGECVSVGMVAACKMAGKLGMMDEAVVHKVTALSRKAQLPIVAKGLDPERVYARMFDDKKVKQNRLNFVLPKAIGEVIQCTIDDPALIRSVLAEVIEV